MTVRRALNIRRPWLGVAVTIGLLAGVLAGAATALASESEAPPTAAWKLEARPAPTNLPLKGQGQIIVTATDIGDASVNAAGHHVTIADQLPEGVEVVAAEPLSKGTPRSHENAELATCGATPIKGPAPISCKFVRSFAPYEQIAVRLTVNTSFTSASEPMNKASVQGGGADDEEPVTIERPLKVNEAPTPFGVESLEMTPENAEFKPDAHAGSHPFQLTTTFNLNEVLGLDDVNGKEKPEPSAPALEQELNFKLPPGLIGNVNAVPQCSGFQFGAFEEHDVNDCPPNTAVGVAVVTFNDPVNPLYFDTTVVPVYNIVPAPGEPARFGFSVTDVPVVLDTSLRTGDDYGVTVSVHNASQAVQILGSIVSFWGYPGDERHNEARGWYCLGENSKGAEFHPDRPCVKDEPPQSMPLLTLPTTCGALKTTASGDAWPGTEDEELKEKKVKLAPLEEVPSTNDAELDECGALHFEPSMEVIPGTEAASTPTDLTVKVNVPQQGLEEPEGRAEGDIEKTTLELPKGMQASPGAAGGLEACSAAQLGFNEPGNANFKAGLPESAQLENDDFSPTLPPVSEALPEPPCEHGSKIGTVEIDTPVLAEPLIGSVYLAEQDTDPFRTPLVVYVVAKGKESGVLVKLAGETRINPSTGQLVSVFEHTPQAPFESLTLHLTKIKRATQATPAHCETYKSKATFVSASGQEEVSESKFKITTGPNGTECPGAQLPFTPSVNVGPTSSQAGAFTNFKLKIERPDGDAALKTISVQLPPGMAAVLASRTPCPEPQAAEGECREESEIGESIARSGLGDSPYDLKGKVYLTGPYDGAPFGLSAVTEADAGPFEVGRVVVRSSISVNKFTTAATIDTEAAQFYAQKAHWQRKKEEEPTPFSALSATPETFSGLPEMLEGVPAQIKSLEVIVNHPGFEFNPTNCEAALEIKGTVTGYESGSREISRAVPVTGCASLPFEPKLTAAVKAQGSKEDGTEFKVTLESAGLGQANIHKVDLTIPAVLPSRLTTIQKACLAATFEANPSSCDEGSVIGEGIVTTPVFKNPLRGPAYLVSHGAAEFPDVEFVLQGENVEVILDGKTDIKNGITYSKFESSPDAPFTKFESIFPEGPHSALGTNVPEAEHYNLCRQTITMPTEITAQDGVVISQTTPVTLVGCGGVKAVTVHHPSKAELLAKALKSCRTKYKHKKAKRLACERTARKKYGPPAKKSSKAHAKKSSKAHAKRT